MADKPQPARTLHFSSLQDVLDEALRIADRPDAPTRGNWSASQNIWHVARYIQASVEGYPFKASLFFRLLGPLLKGRMISRKMASGFQAPEDVQRHMEPHRQPAEATAMDKALPMLEYWISQSREKGFIPANPVFGKMAADQWVALHCRHAELHFGMIQPTV